MNGNRDWLLKLNKQVVVSILLLVLFALFLVVGGEVSQFIVYGIGCWAVGTKVPVASDWIVDKLNKRFG